MSDLGIKWVTVAFIVLLIGIVLLANAGGGDLASLIKWVPGEDKTGHFICMGILSLLVNLSLNAERVTFLKTRVLKGSLIVVVAVTLEEGSQLFIASRSASLTDLLADYLGIIVFGQLARLIVNRRRPATMAG